MDKIPSPHLTSSEYISAIIKITRVFDLMQVKHGIIGSTAIKLHASHYGFPHRFPSNISILIQPSPDFTGEDISAKFSEKRHENDFVSWMIKGVLVPRVIVRRWTKFGEMKLLVPFQLLDRYEFPTRRRDYDLCLRCNSRQCLTIGGGMIKVMNAPWLLRQKLLAWDEREGIERKKLDEMDIRTLRDVLEMQKKVVRIRDETEVEALRKFVDSVNDNSRDFRLVVDCPEVLGPWWQVRRAKVMLLIFGVLVWGLASGTLTETDNQIARNHGVEKFRGLDYRYYGWAVEK